MIIGTSFDRFRHPDGTITGVPRWPLIVLRFSRPMAPFSTPSRASFSLGSGTIGSVALIEPRVDPVERAVILSPRGAPLAKATQYTLNIKSAGGANALAAYDGAEFVGAQSITFTTADDDVVDEPTTDTGAKPCEAYTILTANCTGTFCHGGGLFGDGSGNTPPTMGLNLLYPSAGGDAIQATAVGHAAVEVQDPANPGGTGNPQPGVHFPKGMPIIQPNSAAGSYLMYKILMRSPTPDQDNPTAAYIDPTVSDLHDPGGAVAADLRTRMLGEGMPNGAIPQEPNAVTDAGLPPLSWHDRAVIRAWIDEGAPACPCTRPTGDYDCPPPPPPDAGTDTGGDAATDSGTDTAIDDGSTDAPTADADAGDASTDAVGDAADGGG